MEHTEAKDQLAKLIVSIQSLWFMSNAAFLYYSIRLYFLVLSEGMLSLSDLASFYYYRLFRASLLSFALLFYKNRTPNLFTLKYLKKLLNDTAALNLFLSLVSLNSRPVYVLLIPNLTQATYHSSYFFTYRLLPAIFSFTKYSVGTLLPLDSTLFAKYIEHSSQLSVVVREFYRPIKRFNLLYEVTIIPVYLLVRLILFRDVFFMSFVYFYVTYQKLSVTLANKDERAGLQSTLERYVLPYTPKSIQQVYNQIFPVDMKEAAD